MARTKKVKEESQLEPTPEQAVEELSKLTQEMFPEGDPHNPLIKSTEVVEEESTETEADVPETDDIAVIEAQDVVQGTTEGTQDVSEATGGYDSISSDDIPDIPTSEEFAESFKRSETEEGDSAGDFDPEDPPEGFVESDEDGDGIPEHYVFDWANQPVAATLVPIRETKINSLVEKILFASYLGGELYKNGVQLNRVPYRANVLIPTCKVEQFLSGEGKLEYEEGFNYVDVSVKGINPVLFLKRIMMVGKKGAVISPKKKATNNAGYIVPLKCREPLMSSPSFQVGGNKPRYSLEELKSFGAESLRIVCSWYSLAYKGKVQARIDICNYYNKNPVQ